MLIYERSKRLTQAITISELTASAADAERLAAFYETLFIAGFPDPDERESLENMLAYLKAKEAGWYSSLGPKNSYHIVLAEQNGRAVAGAVCDYLAEPNAGIIEFILVDEQARQGGLGRRLHDAIELILQDDARRAGHAGLDGIIIEMNDPYRVDLASENMDPFVRARLWGRWGYAVLNFEYVQPALSGDQAPVTYLLLCVKPVSSRWTEGVLGQVVIQILRGYLVWAMRIEDPESNAVFQQMSRSLRSQSTVTLTPLDEYVGESADRPFDVVPITAAESDDFSQVMDVYRQSFPPGATAISTETFAETLHRNGVGDSACRYHLWGVRNPTTGLMRGMASFFTLGHGGFVGYLTLTGEFAGTGRCRLLLARIEAQLVRDRPGVTEWFLECEPFSPQFSVFSHLGFSPVPIDYHQPTLSPIDQSSRASPTEPKLVLMRKSVGLPAAGRPSNQKTLLVQVSEILEHVYQLGRQTAMQVAEQMVLTGR